MDTLLETVGTLRAHHQSLSLLAEEAATRSVAGVRLPPLASPASLPLQLGTSSNLRDAEADTEAQRAAEEVPVEAAETAVEAAVEAAAAEAMAATAQRARGQRWRRRPR